MSPKVLIFSGFFMFLLMVGCSVYDHTKTQSSTANQIETLTAENKKLKELFSSKSVQNKNCPSTNNSSRICATILDKEKGTVDNVEWPLFSETEFAGNIKIKIVPCTKPESNILDSTNLKKKKLLLDGGIS